MNLGKTYHFLLQEIKHKISSSRLEAIQAVNRKLIHLYWEIGKLIHQKQEIHGWGKSVVEKLAEDLQLAFPSSRSFSSRNLWFMRQFYEEYSQNIIRKPEIEDSQNLKQAVSDLKDPISLLASVPWGHNILILQRVKEF